MPTRILTELPPLVQLVVPPVLVDVGQDLVVQHDRPLLVVAGGKMALLLGQTKKEYMKLFSDDTDKMPVHGGAFEIPAVMADNTKND